jgi:hypothetical protein
MVDNKITEFILTTTTFDLESEQIIQATLLSARGTSKKPCRPLSISGSASGRL